jgi:hypothetical protein
MTPKVAAANAGRPFRLQADALGPARLRWTLNLRTRRISACALVAVACLLLLAGCVLPTSLTCDGCRARPPEAENLVGVWIGFDESELDFCRLDLRQDCTGFFACVSPAGSSLHEYGVQAYRVTHWAVDEWKFITRLVPATTNAEPVYLRGRCDWTSLELEVGGTNGHWKRKLVLYPESRMDGANQETRDQIQELEKR